MTNPLQPRLVTEMCINHMKHYEPFHTTPFLNGDRIWVIGHGHSRTVRAGMCITEAQGDQLLRDDMRLCARMVSRLVTVPLNDMQLSALAAFVFCLGANKFENSTLLKLLNRGWYEQVPANLMKWVKVDDKVVGDIRRRRKAEGIMWNMKDSNREGELHAEAGLMGVVG